MEENRTEPATPHAGDPSQETAAARGPRGGNGPESVSGQGGAAAAGEPHVFPEPGAAASGGGKQTASGKDGNAAPGGAGPESAVRRRFPTTGDLFAMLGIALGAQALVGLFGLLFSLFAGHGANYNTMEPAALGRLVAALYFVSMAVALGGLLYYRRVRGGRGRWARFSTRGLNPALLLWVFVMMCAVGVVLEPLLALLPELQINVGRGFWTILSLVLFAPVFEELICRGVVLGSLRSRYGVTIAWLVSSLFFGILHGQPVQVVNAFVVGLVLGYVYIATDSLWAAMILHALNNAVAYLMLVTGHANTLLIDLIPGRTLYVAVYVVALAVLVVSGYMMWRALRRMKEAERAKITVAAGALLLAGCREMPRYFSGDETVARAGGRELRMRDVRRVIPQGLTGGDSAAYVKMYVDRWVRKQLKLQEAEILFSESAGDIDRMVEEYRQALLIRKLDQHYVDRSVDTVFTDDEIAAYYNAHKADFRLDRPIVKGRIVRLGLHYRQAAKLKSLMASGSAAQQQDFSDLCAKNDFAVNDFREQWIDFPEFLSYLPTLRSQNYDAMLATTAVQEMRDSHSQYYFQIDEVRREGEPIPLERLRPTIRRILFNRRQGEVIRRHEEELFDRASENGEVSVYGLEETDNEETK